MPPPRPEPSPPTRWRGSAGGTSQPTAVPLFLKVLLRKSSLASASPSPRFSVAPLPRLGDDNRPAPLGGACHPAPRPKGGMPPHPSGNPLRPPPRPGKNRGSKSPRFGYNDVNEGRPDPTPPTPAGFACAVDMVRGTAGRVVQRLCDPHPNATPNPFTPTAHPHPFHGADYRASHPRLTPARGP